MGSLMKKKKPESFLTVKGYEEMSKVIREQIKMERKIPKLYFRNKRLEELLEEVKPDN